MNTLDENYWNNKWPKAPIIYNGRTLKNSKNPIPIDVKNFIEKDDAILQKVISTFNLKKPTHDETALEIQKWVVGFLTYKGDNDNVEVPEYWQFPFEVINSKIGDCEDGAILMASLCENAGIPAWRIKVAAGYVQPEPTAPQGGHAYCVYLAEDAEWRIIDWCYYQDSSIPIKDKPLAKDGGQKKSYKEIWFTFNSQYSWTQVSFELEKRVSNFDYDTMILKS